MARIVCFQFWDTGRPGRLGLTLREHGHKLDVRRPDHDGAAAIPGDLDDVHGLVILGGPQNVDEGHAWLSPLKSLVKAAHDRELPIIGICLGCQIIAESLGGRVGRMDKPEVGMSRVSLTPPGQIETMLAGVPWACPQFSSHGHEVKELPAGATLLAGSKACKIEAFRVGLRTYAFQYHFECDRDMIDTYLNEPSCSPEKIGRGRDEVAREVDAAYEMFARAGDRLCVNLASYAFAFDSLLAV